MADNCEPKEPATPAEGTKPEAGQPASKTKRAASIAAIVIGLLLVCAGMFSVTHDSELNDAMIEVGTEQTVKGLIDQYPNTKEWVARTADALEAAIEARAVAPDKLIALLETEAKAYMTPGIKSLVRLLIDRINTSYKISETEEEYIGKLNHLVAGMRDGVTACSDVK